MYVPTCNQYVHIIKNYAALFNKYWGEHQKAVVLGFKSPKEKLPKNFEFISLGDQEDFGRAWTDPLIPFFDSIDDEYFMFNLDDSFLIDYVDDAKVARMESFVEGGYAVKAMLHSHLNAKYGRQYENQKDIILLDQDAPYRTSIHPAIWTKKYFMKFLKPGFTIWDFELKNMPESKIDGEVIVSYNFPNVNQVLINPTNHIFNMVNVYRRGILDVNGGIASARAEDKALIIKMVDDHANGKD